MRKVIDLSYIINGEEEFAEHASVDMTENGFIIRRGDQDIFFPTKLCIPSSMSGIDYEVAMTIEKQYPEVLICHAGATHEQMQEAYSYMIYVPIIPPWVINLK